MGHCDGVLWRTLYEHHLSVEEPKLLIRADGAAHGVAGGHLLCLLAADVLDAQFQVILYAACPILELFTLKFAESQIS